MQVIQVKQDELKNRQRLSESEFLQQYNQEKYQRPSVTVDMLIFTVTDEERFNYRKLPEKTLKLLLIKRGNHPFIGQWALPGGFVGIDESLDQAALRELREETNIDRVYMEQLYTWGDVNRDPRTRVISSSYLALVDQGSLNVRAGDDAADAGWFGVEHAVVKKQQHLTAGGFRCEQLVEVRLNHETEELSALIKVVETREGQVCKVERELLESRGIAFDHGKIIEYAVQRLRNKLEYTDIVFNLMPEVFTLSELQQVYEVILGRPLLAAAFRRKIAPLVRPTEGFTKNAGHRPSRLYRFNPLWKNTKQK